MMMKLLKSLDNLISTIDNGIISENDFYQKYNYFVETVEEAWLLLQQGKIKTNLDSLAKVMYFFTVNDLPQLVKDLDRNNHQLKQQLLLFKNTIEKILVPQEVDGS